MALTSSGGENAYMLTGELEADCCGGGYDIKNASVEIRDEDDELIGSTTTGGNIANVGCRVEWQAEVPEANFYQVKIGTQDGHNYSFEELEASDFHLELML